MRLARQPTICMPLERLRWEVAGIPLCQLDVRASELAAHLKFPLAHWEEDGLGRALGFACQLPSGVRMLVVELAHAIDHLGAKGPVIEVDASGLVAQGTTLLMEEVLRALGLSVGNCQWRAGTEVVELARRLSVRGADAAPPGPGR
jgi:hypothetical protein